jgi:hypothetical protein
MASFKIAKPKTMVPRVLEDLEERTAITNDRLCLEGHGQAWPKVTW